jgi:F0F1-type ATP synthase assembly protein I
MPDQKQPNPYIKYSNLAIQMAVTIGLGAWGGQKLDKHYQTSKPVFTIVLSLLGIAAALYFVLKDFIKPKD